MGYKRRRRYRKRSSQWAVAKKAVSAVLKKRLEVKSFSFAWGLSIGNTPLTWNPIGINLFDYLRMGTEDFNRIGNRVNNLSTSIRCNVESADSPYNQMRLMLVETRNKLQITLAGGNYDCQSLFEDIAILGLNAPLNFDVVSKVYFDKLVSLNQHVAGQNVIKFVNRYIKFGKNGKKIYYLGDITPSLGENTNTNVYFVVMSDSSVAPHPRINMVWKNRFTDS